MKITAYISRLLLGIVFIYSGFVKAVDPWGSQFKFEDYFIAFNMEWLIPMALVFAILLSAAEFLIGAAFLFGIKPKLSVWSAVAFMAIFTPLTLWLAITNAVGDCGCFGDALILTNWETFYKNIVIVALLIPVFLYRKKFGHYMSCKLEWVPVFIFAAGIVFTSFYGMRHLPVIDFLPYKPGLSMKPDSTMKDKYFVSYKDKTTGETKEYPADDFPWDDTTWMPCTVRGTSSTNNHTVRTDIGQRELTYSGTTPCQGVHNFKLNLCEGIYLVTVVLPANM